MLGGTVKLRVNGGPADLNDLKQIDPKMVRRVEYHDMPSMRYGKVEAVIDLYVKRQDLAVRAELMLRIQQCPRMGMGLPI